MKGEWLRYSAGLVSREDAVAAIEDAWKSVSATVRGRPVVALSRSFERSRHPERGGGGTGQPAGPGPFRVTTVRAPLRSAGGRSRHALHVFLQDPSGQVPANGRTDDHVWVDVGYQLAFEVMAERAFKRGELESAGQFRHAALLAFQNIARWRRTDGAWAGSYFITKNHFDPALRVGYQTASQYSNYSGSLMFHLAEAFHIRSSPIREAPSPSEIGGYTMATDARYAAFSPTRAACTCRRICAARRRKPTAILDAAWGSAVRASRLGLAPGPIRRSLGRSRWRNLRPEFLENGQWLRLADLSSRYRGVWSTSRSTRCSCVAPSITVPVPDLPGPSFRDEFTLTPDGVLSVVTKISGDNSRWAVTWPVIENDGTPLERSGRQGIQTVRYPNGSDEQNFIAVGASRPHSRMRRCCEAPLVIFGPFESAFHRGDQHHLRLSARRGRPTGGGRPEELYGPRPRFLIGARQSNG